MFKIEELKPYRKAAESFLLAEYPDVEFNFNHFGIITPNYDGYREFIDSLGSSLTETFFKGRHTSTVQSPSGLLEVYEPAPGTYQSETHLDHIAFTCKDFVDFLKNYTGELVSKFDVGETHGIKIHGGETIIEIRNNDILDSVKDFTDENH